MSVVVMLGEEDVVVVVKIAGKTSQQKTKVSNQIRKRWMESRLLDRRELGGCPVWEASNSVILLNY